MVQKTFFNEESSDTHGYSLDNVEGSVFVPGNKGLSRIPTEKTKTCAVMDMQQFAAKSVCFS